MKKIQIVILTIAISIFLSANIQAADNWFYERLEFGERIATGESYSGTYTILENNSVRGLSLGAKVITGQDGYTKLYPYAFKSVAGGWQIGAKYSSDSNKTETLGPAVRFKGKIGKMYVIFDYVHDFDLKDGGGSKNDCWLYLNTTNLKFNVGSEVWFFDYMNGSENWQVRPVRLSYKKWGMNFFLMPNWSFKDKRLIGRSVMTGFDFNF